MGNKIVHSLKILIYSILLTILLLTILILTKDYFLDYIISYIEKDRGTSHYVGETKVAEFFSIIWKIILPVLFIISIILVALKLKK
ncbi:hypothetical protein [Tenacibaculum finnmarkense]|uniref:hypothetical protein n=1 Tax=Tenacibaculum finnmarkense TaxID=2781243 RepID=UPI001EFAAED6|nr:hypothetical protein [Tenacibaculum finnmarkense]MCG8234859.1 hypothetical protein [Tenacibaculum finnmarkense genomovar finnmarkense]MCG8245122.1 hypothetical protein [Tenacibaculum finnmarkense genomovar finnmarkense]MCG8250550.1 hypothetical protein [Tenacibaculum finnmarkense genomovar finnmarkense]MCG8745345.1 hypothetical protein [Tenacibaculum finnmarkense]MCG8801594.1 hypothetical protein [Tenacibaculum finnmarkense]